MKHWMNNLSNKDTATALVIYGLLTALMFYFTIVLFPAATLVKSVSQLKSVQSYQLLIVAGVGTIVQLSSRYF